MMNKKMNQSAFNFFFPFTRPSYSLFFFFYQTDTCDKSEINYENLSLAFQGLQSRYFLDHTTDSFQQEREQKRGKLSRTDSRMPGKRCESGGSEKWAQGEPGGVIAN